MEAAVKQGLFYPAKEMNIKQKKTIALQVMVLFDFVLQATSRQLLVSSKINRNQQRLKTTAEISVLCQKYHNIVALKLSLYY